MTPLPVNDYDIAKIKGLKKGYRIRLGTIRTIIELNPKENEIFILKIDQRAKIYRDFNKLVIFVYNIVKPAFLIY